MTKLVPAILALTLTACGDNQAQPTPPDAGPDGPGATDPCPPITLGTAELQFNWFNELTGVRYPITGGGLDGSLLVIELYDESTGGLPKLSIGSFDLATTPNNNLATCQHCVYIATERADRTLELSYFQAEGSLALTTVTDPLEPVFAGTITAQLRAATADDTGTSTFVPDGACRRVETLAFDTTPTDAACTTLVDCPNELLQVCDPRSQRCVAPQCDWDFGGCSETQVCVPQRESESYGACYDVCNPREADPCGAGFTCWQTGPQETSGWCLREGAGAAGETCEVADASSACTGELACSHESNTCTSACTLFEDVPGCGSNERCSLFGRCEPPSIADPATFGQTCAATAELAAPCAADTVGFQGYCFSYRLEDPLVCIEACMNDGDCTAAQYCSMRFTSGLGTCLPDPVCGDGALGEIDEVCDDGNTTGGDTCSADCQTIDYTASCAAATAITDGQSIDGNTRTALDGFMASCQAGRARTSMYRFAPGTPGKLTVTVDSAFASAVSILESCGDAPVENACGITAPVLTDTLETQLVTADPVTIGVAAYTVLEEGAHTITVDFVPELCGDSIIAGREVCDDGNTSNNDGCSSDCRTIEYGVVCANATPLVLGTNTGSTATAPFLYEGSCTARGSGRDRVYTFTAPTAGTLDLSLDEGDANLALTVYDGCGVPAAMTELACSSVYVVEAASVSLTAGQQVTVVVDGFLPASAGPYTLTAAFQ